MTHKDTIKKWSTRIKWAQKIQDRHDSDYKAIRNMYELIPDTEEAYIDPSVYSAWSTRGASLFTKLPPITVVEKNSEDLGTAPLIEKILDEAFLQADAEKSIRDTVFSANIFDIGVLKIGYNITTSSRKFSEEENFENFVEKYPEGNEDDYTAFISEKTNLSEEIEDFAGVWIDNIHPSDILFDPESKELESCKWVIHKLMYSEEEFKEIFNKSPKNAETEFISSSLCDISALQERCPEEFSRIVVYDIWSKETKEHLIISGDLILEQHEWPFDFVQYPFEVLVLEPSYNNLRGLKTILMTKPAIDASNNIYRQQINDAQTNSSGLVIPPKSANDDEIDGFLAPGGKKIIRVAEPERIVPFGFPNISNDTFNMVNRIESKVQEVSSVSAFRKGSTPVRKETATAVRVQEEAADVQVFSKTSLIERMIERLSYKVLALIKQFASGGTTQLDNVFGENLLYVNWVKEDLGEYLFTVKAGSAAIQNDAIKLQQHLQFFQLILQSKENIPNPAPLIESELQAIGKYLDIEMASINEAFTPQQPTTAEGVAGVVGGEGALPQQGTSLPTPNQTAVNKQRAPTLGGVDIRNRGA